MGPREADILLRVGGGMLRRFSSVAVAGAGRGRAVPLPYVFTRADTSPCATLLDPSGTVRLAAADKLRVEWVDLDGDGVRETCGLLLEGTRTNVVLWNRDLTNAAWTKVNVTAAKDQIGVDGVASGASKITASAANGTCLQAITLASSARAQSCYVKRVTGSGVINMTMDNGATWTAITVTAAYTRVTIPTQTLANPTVGFRIVTNGDAIAVDYVQNENGAFYSSVIPVTTVAVVRATDLLTVPCNFGPFDTTVLLRIARPVWADASGDIGLYPTLFNLGIVNDPNSRIDISGTQAVRTFQGRFGTSASEKVTAIPAGAELAFTTQCKNAASAPAVALDAGSGLTASDTGAPPFTAYSNQTLTVGHPAAQPFAVVVDVMIARGLFTRAEMMAIA